MLYKKYFSEHLFYFIGFILLSILFIVNGYATLDTNDDWALRNMLMAKGIYGTLIMCYPLSYIISHLYDFFPLGQWYSILLASVVAVNFYFISHYIEEHTSYIQKFILLILALLWITYLWFFMSITTLTILTIITAIGLINRNLFLSFIFIFLSFFLRSDIMLIFIPYYVVAYFILRHTLSFKRREFFTLFSIILIIVLSCFLQKKDTQYNEWLTFNKARSGIVDMGVAHMDKAHFTKEERYSIHIGWWQDRELLPTKKVLLTGASLKDILWHNIENIHLLHFLKTHKFKHWIWLLLLASLYAMILNRKNKKVFFIPIFVSGVILLILTRDVERVTVPLIILWFYVSYESLKAYKWTRTLFLLSFTAIFYYYISSQLAYRYFKEVTALQNEARELIKDSNKSCEVSIHYPTTYINEINTIFKVNYLFHENNWLQVNETEILPTGWLSRHKFFNQTHHISDAYTQRKYKTYHDYLIDDHTAFFGSHKLVKNKAFKILLHAYDRRYLQDKPTCKHRNFLIAQSKHFGISQIRIECDK